MTHYRDGAFRPKMIFWRSPLRTHRAAVAAAVACVVLVASACYFIISRPANHPQPQPAQLSPSVEQTAAPSVAESLRLEFADAPLSSVISEIESAYGVEISEIPAEVDSIRLTLSFEGSAIELVYAINQITGLSLQVNGAQ